MTNERPPLDVVQVAAERGVVDESTARLALGNKPPTLEALAQAVGLNAEDMAMVLEAFQKRAGKVASDDPSSSVRCARCGDLFVRKGEQLVCPGCGSRVPIISPHEDTVLVEVSVAEKDPANHYGRYIRYREIGKGAFGAVWLAWDPELGRRVALKIVSIQEESAHEWFHREARIAASLRHPHIVPVHEFGRKGAEAWMAMAYVEGRGLHEGAWTPERAAAVMVTVAQAVHTAHRAGIVHRDLKPHNVLLDENGHPYVTDFGLARRLLATSGTLAATGAVIGTPAYMAPELAAGKVHADERSDVYALGATLYHMLAGKAPYTGKNPLEVLRNIQTKSPGSLRRVNPEVPRELEAVVQKAMARNPLRRYAGASAMAEDLARFLEGARTHALHTQRFRIQRRKLIAAAAALGSALLLIGLVVGWFLFHWDRAPELISLDPPVDLPPRTLLLLDSGKTEWGYLTVDGRLCRRAGGAEVALESDAPFTAAALDPRGELLAAGTESGGVSLWRLDAVERIAAKRLHESPVKLVLWSSSGEWILSADARGGFHCIPRGFSEEPNRLVPPASREMSCRAVALRNDVFAYFRAERPVDLWWPPNTSNPCTADDTPLDLVDSANRGWVAGVFRGGIEKEGEPVREFVGILELLVDQDGAPDLRETARVDPPSRSGSTRVLAVQSEGSRVLLTCAGRLYLWTPGAAPVAVDAKITGVVLRAEFLGDGDKLLLHVREGERERVHQMLLR